MQPDIFREWLSHQKRWLNRSPKRKSLKAFFVYAHRTLKKLVRKKRKNVSSRKPRSLSKSSVKGGKRTRPSIRTAAQVEWVRPFQRLLGHRGRVGLRLTVWRVERYPQKLRGTCHLTPPTPYLVKLLLPLPPFQHANTLLGASSILGGCFIYWVINQRWSNGYCCRDLGELRAVSLYRLYFFTSLIR